MNYTTSNSAYGSFPPGGFIPVYLPQNSAAFQNIQNTPPPLRQSFSQTMSIPGHLQRQTSAVLDDRPVGLHNFQNNCYMNAVLQQLFLIIDFQMNINMKPVTRAYKRLRDSHSYQDYYAFKAELEKRLDFVRGSQQQDAQEFLREFIELLAEENSQYRSYLGKPNRKFDVNPKLSTRENYNNFMAEMQKRESSDILFIFGGETYTQISCAQGHFHYSFDRFMDVTVSFPSVDRTYSITELLLHDMQQEMLTDVDCDQCRRRGSALKSTLFYSLPPNLVIHANRFWQGRTSNAKIATPISFDEYLEIPAERCHTDMLGQRRSYQLVGVVNHIGTIDSGHYYCDIRGANGTKWYQCNDQVVN